MCGFNFLFSAGRPIDGAARCAMALDVDPLNGFTVTQQAVCLHAAGEYNRALSLYLQALELDERNFLAHLNIALWHFEFGNLADAVGAANAACAIAPANPWAVACRAALHTRLGNDANAADVLSRLGDGDRYGAPAGFCRYYTLVGDLGAAAEWAQRAIAQRDAAFPFALQMSCAAPLRTSAHWPAIAAAMNLQ
jgi:tetratricopeptide (TPR) repeat protein